MNTHNHGCVICFLFGFLSYILYSVTTWISIWTDTNLNAPIIKGKQCKYQMIWLCGNWYIKMYIAPFFRLWLLIFLSARNTPNMLSRLKPNLIRLCLIYQCLSNLHQYIWALNWKMFPNDADHYKCIYNTFWSLPRRNVCKYWLRMKIKYRY